MNANWLYRHGLNLLAIALLATMMAPTAKAQQPTGDRLYRVIVMDNLDEKQAQDVKKLMEGWTFIPTIVQTSGDKFQAVYGEFATHAEAVRAKQQLEREGIQNGDIVSEPRAGVAAPPAESYTVVVQEFVDRPMALELRDKLQKQGFGNPQVRRDDKGSRPYYQVTVGVYSSIEDARGTLTEFFRQGYQTARVQTIRGEAVQAIAAPVTPTPTPGKHEIAPPPITKEEALSPLITQSDLWKSLSDEQKRQVLMQLEIERAQRSATPDQAKLIGRMIDLEKRLANLSKQVQDEIDLIKMTQEKDKQIRDQLSSLYSQATNAVQASKNRAAISALKEITKLDNDNRFGYRNHAMAQIELLERQEKGDMYPGQMAVIEKSYKTYQNTAQQSEAVGDIDSLQRAIDAWTRIQLLDPKYEPEAKDKISDLTIKLNNLKNEKNTRTQKDARTIQMIEGGLGVAIVAIGFMLLLIWTRGRKRHMELMRKVQEITTIRPMRELGANETPLLGAGPAKSDSEPDIFTPRTPRTAVAAADDAMANAGDPLAMAPAKPAAAPAPAKEKKSFFGRKKKDKEAPKAEPEAAPAAAAMATDESLDALFGGSTETVRSETMQPEPAKAEAAPAEPKAVGDDFNLDDIFGGSTPSPAPKAEAPQPAPAKAAAPAADEDPFSALFNESPAPQPAAVASAKPAAAAETQEPVVIGGTTTPEADNTDLLSIFDEVVGGSVDTDADQTRPQEKISMSRDDDPFASMLGSPSAPPARHEDETEIPGIKLDEPAVDSPFNFDLSGITPESESTRTEFQNMPNFDTMGQGGNGSTGVSLDFEDDALGQPPHGWEGHYDYADLTVEADTPCKSGQQYVRFQKREGNGKAHYRFRFGDISGVVAIEFDMCCNDKNKFLLGFYVERDGDFQQSVHTKILRSEAQTTPTIHMQGEAAPYLLGSWAHIKYVVDLNEGRINGYIDSTHVVRDLPLNPNPQVLNTLSIRDNINTTGDLMLDNIKVYQVS